MSATVHDLGYHAKMARILTTGLVKVTAHGRTATVDAETVLRLTSLLTDDRVAVTVGLRVFTNDWQGGEVIEVGAPPATGPRSQAGRRGTRCALTTARSVPTTGAA